MFGMAVIGCGRIGRMHARNLSQHPRVELISVYDIVAKSAADTASSVRPCTVATSRARARPSRT